MTMTDNRNLNRDMLIEQRIANDGPKLVLAYLLWFLLGGFGAHRYYLSHWRTGLAQSGLALAQMVMVGTDVGVLLALLWAGWIVVDAFLIPSMARAKRDEMRKAMEMQHVRYA